MAKSIEYKEIKKILLSEIKGKRNLNVLEIGCGGKVYKNLFLDHKYQGLDMINSKWTLKEDPPEIITKFSNFKSENNYNLIFAVTTLSMFDNEDLNNLIQIININKNNYLKFFFFDWKEKIILKNPIISNRQYNNYKEKLSKSFKNNISILDNEWCSENLIKKKVKETFNMGISQIIKIEF